MDTIDRLRAVAAQRRAKGLLYVDYEDRVSVVELEALLDVAEVAGRIDVAAPNFLGLSAALMALAEAGKEASREAQP